MDIKEKTMLRGALVGLGRMGLTHLSILRNHPKVNFVAICDSSSFVLRNVGKYIGIEAFKDYRKMIDEVDLDFVIVATPVRLHIEVVKYAVQNNLHVFVEKPFCLDAAQGSEIVNMVNGKNLVNQVGYVLRFNDVFRDVKKLLQAKVIGDPLFFKMEMSGPTVLKNSESTWRSKRSEGGGCLRDFASHSIDLVNYLLGAPEQVVGTVLKKIYSKNVEDAVYSTFLYRNGLLGHVRVNWSDPSHRKPTYRVEILGRNGKMIADPHTCKLFLKNAPVDGEFTSGWNMRYITDLTKPVRFYVRGNEFTQQLDYFIDCIFNGSYGNMCSFADGLATDSIIEKLIKNSAERCGQYG